MNMKSIVAVSFAAAVGVSTGAVAQGTKEMPPGSAVQSSTHAGTGMVKKLDVERNRVTLDHGPIASMKWPSMTMEFEVSDRTMLDNLKPGSKVQFRFAEKSKGKYLITEIKGRND